ncbi:beta-ketoacyl-ACP synthase III [Candidatus Latescibacterota bacterium]
MKRDTPVITGTGFAVPEQVWDNHRLEQMVDTSDEWIQSRTGIVTRRIAADGETTATLGAAAAREAIEDAGVSVRDIDVIIVATMTPDMPFPATACFVQNLIGAKNVAAFDISAACTGFVYGIGIAQAMVASGMANHILLIGTEVLSRITDWTDRNTCVLFGDGAGAAVISREGTGAKIIDTIIHADGGSANLLYMPGGGVRHPASEKTLRDRLHYIKMTGKGLYKEATTSMAGAVEEILKKNGLTVADMDLLIPHQANLRIILSTAKKLDISPEKTYVNIQRYGNTSAATIPIAMAEAQREGRITPPMNVVLTAFGSGMTWGAALLRYE